MKFCTGCKEDKPFAEFNRSRRAKDGWQCWCRVCGREARRLYTLRRTRDPRHRDRLRARAAVNQAVKRGTLVRSKICEECGRSRCMIEADHYKGYAKEHWLTVRFLCSACHGAKGHPRMVA